MPNIKKYYSIFIAEDARHADRLIYVLNECRQEVPPILYKISEAYTNSGKDVDRMPSREFIWNFYFVVISWSDYKSSETIDLHNYSIKTIPI